MNYKLIMFDFDGTLADSLPWFLQVANQAADKYKFKRLAESEIDTLRGYDARRVIKYLGVPAWKIPLIARYMRGLMLESAGEISLFEGIDNLIKRLADKKVILAVVTANSYANVQRILGPELAARITYYECSVPMFGKSRRFRKILLASGVRREEALCVGDELRDSEAARRERIPFGAVSWGMTHVEALKAHAPHEVFSSVDEMIAKLT